MKHYSFLRISLLSLFFLSIASCVNDLKKIDEIASQKDLGVETGKNVEVLVSNNGEPRVKIIATETKRHMEGTPYTEFPRGIKAYTYNIDGEIESSMTAKYATITERNGQIETMNAKNDVVVVNIKGEKLNTEDLTWIQSNKRIYAAGFVRITTPDEIIYGDGMEAKEDFSEYTIKKVTGKVKVKKDDL
jgi:LPS export ABC transporter protein LptC